MKEMVGGCCVCSDERGWQENPLVYCDGQDCTVAVHQACYGIVAVPAGPWYCEKCTSGENMARFKCDLCPMREGALKRTDKNGWAHVVCALYIPEVRFGDVSTMDPIILSQVPPDRFNKVCYICEDKGFMEKSKVGACMQCNKNGCKACFHVTCAQQEGLLCEESSIQDNIKYCGYCSHHFKKLRKGDSIKAVPPYRPVVPTSLSTSSSTPGSTNNERSPMVNNAKNPTNVGGNGTNIHTNSNNNHHSNQRENCIKSSMNTSKFSNLSSMATTSTTASLANVSLSNVISSPPSNSAISISQAKSSIAVATSGIYVPQPTLVSSVGIPTTLTLAQPLPPAPRPLIMDGVPETASTTWATKPVPHISYLGFNNDILHSNTSGHVVGGSTAANSLPSTSTLVPAPATIAGLHALAPIAAISSVIPPSGFIAKITPSPIIIPNSGNLSSNQSKSSMVSGGQISNVPVDGTVTTSIIMTASTPSGTSTTKRSNRTPGSSGGHKRKSDNNKDQSGTVSGESANEKPKKPRRNSTKSVASLLELVSPVVEDTVASFQQEKVASQKNDVYSQQKQLQQLQQQQLLHHQHQQSSIDSVIAATAAGHQSSQFSAALMPDRSAAPSMTTPVLASDAIEQPSITTPVANIVHPPPPKSTPFRSPQEAPSIAGPSSFPTSLEQLLERQWEQGSQFLMEQAQHFDIASLLSCLHQLKVENQRLEDHVVNLSGRRDHLLAVNARLSISLGHQQHQSPNSPRVNASAPLATPFLHLQAPNSQDTSHDTSESASSRLSAPPNTSTPIALQSPFIGANIVPVVSTSKAIQPASAVSSSIVVSPTSRSALASLTAPMALSNFPVVPGVSGVGSGGVFSNVKNKPSQEPSPDRQQLQQQAPGSFLIPRTPTPMLATDLVRPQTSLISNQYPIAQDHRMFYQLMQHQQNALAAAVYGNAFSIMQSTSPHRAAATAALVQSHITPHAGPTVPSNQDKN